ncbi:MAG: hypothetical protein PVI13_07925 [Desulfobacterales bacterium]|jgi:hypothetical protein
MKKKMRVMTEKPLNAETPLIGIDQPYAWRHWEFLWDVRFPGDYTIMARATDTNGRRQPETAHWNVFGYGNNGVREHAVTVRIED